MTSTGLISAGTRRMLQHALDRYSFDHVYTRTHAPAPNPDSVDPYGQPIPGTPVVTTGLPCHYDENPAQIVIGGQGIAALNRPVIMVPSTDTLDVGDQVGSIKTLDGVVLFAGTYRVEDTWAIAPGQGGVVTTIFTLRVTEEVEG